MKKNFDLGNDSIKKLLFTFSVPCIISMLINAVYNIVDQIFIGQGVGYLGNGATNIIFPLVLIFTALAQLIGNGCAAYLSLKLGEKDLKSAKKAVGSSITLLFICSIVFSVIAYIFLPDLIKLFGCTENIYPYALEYGKIILLGMPFMVIYTGLSSIIRSDGSPKYSMISIVIGAILNIILDPIFIFGFGWGVAGGALATVIGQGVSALITIYYLRKFKSFRLEKKDFKLGKHTTKILTYGLSSSITQLTVLVIFVIMNNLMTNYGAVSKFGSDIPLSVFGVVSKLNQVFISIIIGLACGAQPIIGYNYGAGKFDRVKQTIKEVIKYAFIIGLICSAIFILFPGQLVGIFGSSDNPLYFEFAVDCCRIYLMASVVNAIQMSAGNLVQALGKVGKATFISVLRQIILFVPLALLLSSFMGLYGSLWAEVIADLIAVLISGGILWMEYKKIGIVKKTDNSLENTSTSKHLLNQPIVITINREYGSGGRYIGQLLSEKLGIPFYDKELIRLVSKESGLSLEYIENNEEVKKQIFPVNSTYDIDDQLFIEESKIIQKLAKEGSCVIIGRCADYILRDYKNVFNIFIYNNEIEKMNRVTKYYQVPKKNAAKQIYQMNQNRKKYYQHYTSKNWNAVENYAICLNSDLLGIEASSELLKEIILKKEK